MSPFRVAVALALFGVAIYSTGVIIMLAVIAITRLLKGRNK